MHKIPRFDRPTASNAVLGPACVDQRAHLAAHFDLLGPGAGALVEALRRRVDADLAANELPRGGMVEMVGWPWLSSRSRAGSTFAPT